MSAIIISFAPASANAEASSAKTEPASKASAVKAGLQKMEYDVYAGGFHVVAADLTVDTLKKTNYFIRLNANTYGMIAKLAPWDGYFESKGWYDPKTGQPRPELHVSNSVFRGESELKEYRYRKDGSFVDYRVKDPENDGTPKDVPAELTDNTTDAFSSALRIMAKIAQDGKCEGKDEVFDGSRRFTQIFKHKANVELKANDYNLYSGPAIECTLEVVQGPGKWHEKPRGWMSIQEQGRERGTLPTVWFAQLAEGQPAVPVKVRVKTQYGTLFMHLTGYQGDGKSMKLAQQ